MREAMRVTCRASITNSQDENRATSPNRGDDNIGIVKALWIYPLFLRINEQLADQREP